MMILLVHVLTYVLLQYLVVGQDGAGCTGNLVHKLRQCATAINGNEQLLVQMEKCSPDSCNYDCPALDSVESLENDVQVKLDGLEQSFKAKLENLTEALQQIKIVQEIHSKAIANNTEDIQSLNTKVDELQDYCGSTGWTRIAELDMSNSSHQCPTEYRQYDMNGVRACGRQISPGASCDSIVFSANGKSYSQVCGRVIGYQYASPDAFDYLRRAPQNTGIENPYVDGVSITHGSPRQHIWTFVASILSNGQESTQNYCPCDGTGRISAPDFVGEDYFCESGNPASQGWAYTLYTDDPIWDGKNCGTGEAQCCSVPGIPYFHKVLDSPTSDSVEMRICAEKATSEEDTPLALYDIYIK